MRTDWLCFHTTTSARHAAALIPFHTAARVKGFRTTGLVGRILRFKFPNPIMRLYRVDKDCWGHTWFCV